jgi:CrcB protein
MVIWVACGAAIGGALRYWCSGLIAESVGETFPWGTLFVNVVGSFLIGLVAVSSGPDGRLLIPAEWRAFVMVGVFGGFTTFSSFSLQTLSLLQDGDWGRAILNIGLSVLMCMLGVWLGAMLGAVVNRGGV